MNPNRAALRTVGALVLLVVLVGLLLSAALFGRFLGDLAGHRVDVLAQAQATITVTPAGRERYLPVLSPYVQRLMHSGVAAGWQLWENICLGADAAFIQRLASEHAWISVVPYSWAAADDKGSCLGVTHFLGHALTQTSST